ncbi:methyltransferase [Pavlovales sp. CCMP2436]|nr:methyltransferase [Pavlovales sp. CCMP2436]
MSRPELQAPAEIFYGETEARKYLHNSRMIQVQGQMAERALEGGLVHDDMGCGLPFRDGLFDGAISISAIQWLCHAETSEQNPRKRLKLFFESLYKTLRRGARAVLQFYPQNPEQLQLITASAMRAGFGGGVVVDFPHSTRAKKYFLCLLAGQPDPNFSLPTAMGSDGMEQEEEAGERRHVQNVGRSRQHAKRAGAGIKKRKRPEMKSRDWVVHKKEGQRKQGKFAVRPDTKYTARSRRPQF